MSHHISRVAGPDHLLFHVEVSTVVCPDTLCRQNTCCAGRRVQCYSSEVTAAILQKNEENPVMIYSKTWCPFCTSMKSLFIDTLKVDAKFAELDQLGTFFEFSVSCFSGTAQVMHATNAALHRSELWDLVICPDHAT